jgi:hypothetical protein
MTAVSSNPAAERRSWNPELVRLRAFFTSRENFEPVKRLECRLRRQDGEG